MADGESMGTGLIAVIDDDRVISQLFTEILTDDGYAVALWYTGAGAFAFVKRVDPALVILDMHMETQDAGMRVADALCHDPETKAIPVIICSAALNTEREKRQRLEALGCNIHSKPIDMHALLALIGKLTSPAAVAGQVHDDSI
jgi:two-component system, NtrC family, sensor kinase